MSDVLAPFLELYPRDDAMAYLCFSALLQRLRLNYVEGQPGVHDNLQQSTSLLQRSDKKLWKQIGKHGSKGGVDTAAHNVALRICI